MTALNINFDRITIIGLALAATLPFLAISPVKAGEPGGPANACAIEAQALRLEATAATPNAAAKALRTVRTAEAICAEGNRFEAAKKFAQARQQLAVVQLAERR